eukprot:Gb_34340 [translate_table: standard]
MAGVQKNLISVSEKPRGKRHLLLQLPGDERKKKKSWRSPKRSVASIYTRSSLKDEAHLTYPLEMDGVEGAISTLEGARRGRTCWRNHVGIENGAIGEEGYWLASVRIGGLGYRRNVQASIRVVEEVGDVPMSRARGAGNTKHRMLWKPRFKWKRCYRATMRKIQAGGEFIEVE